MTTYEYIKIKENRKRESKIVRRINKEEGNKVLDEQQIDLGLKMGENSSNSNEKTLNFSKQINNSN